MIDIHCHILYGVDEGPDSLHISLEMCRQAIKEGIEKIIATPHYIIGERYDSNISEKIKTLNNELKNNNIGVEVLPGNEAFIDFGLVDRLSNKECLTLSNSKYVLLEVPMLEVPRFTENVIYELLLKGYIPILAHPERNRAINVKPEIVYELVRNGCLMQLNSTSLFGLSGEKAENTAKQLLSHNLVHFIATDAHSAGR
ncbi:MAG: tyrosine-protein phosphatase [Caulobacteraceae bacterium]